MREKFDFEEELRLIQARINYHLNIKIHKNDAKWFHKNWYAFAMEPYLYYEMGKLIKKIFFEREMEVYYIDDCSDTPSILKAPYSKFEEIRKCRNVYKIILDEETIYTNEYSFEPYEDITEMEKNINLGEEFVNK